MSLTNLELSSYRKCKSYILLKRMKTICTVKPLALSLLAAPFSTSWWPINHLEPQTEKENPHKNIPLTFPGCHAIQHVVLPRSLLARTSLTRAFVQVGRLFTDLPLALL